MFTPQEVSLLGVLVVRDTPSIPENTLSRTDTNDGGRHSVSVLLQGPDVVPGQFRRQTIRNETTGNRNETSTSVKVTRDLG